MMMLIYYIVWSRLFLTFIWLILQLQFHGKEFSTNEWQSIKQLSISTSVSTDQ